MKRATACLYARVSTANQHQNPEAQLRDLRAFAKQRQWENHTRICRLGRQRGEGFPPGTRQADGRRQGA